MKTALCGLAVLLVASAAVPAGANPDDPKATIADVLAFVSTRPGTTDRVTLIMTVDPLLEPGADAERALFDPDVLYEIKIDNDNDAVEDIVFQFRFATASRLPESPLGYLGVPGGATAPANSPAPVAPGSPVVPSQITAFSSPGLGLRQSYRVTMIKGGVATPLTGAGTLFAVPGNSGPRTMDYAALFAAGTHSLASNIQVFAGRVDDPSFADLGGLHDTLNFSKSPPVLSAAEDAALVNLASDTRSGFSLNAIAIEVPIAQLTRTGAIEPAGSVAATLGIWATTSRRRLTVRRSPIPPVSSGAFVQVDRRGNPLVTELLLGTGFKEAYRLGQPQNDAAFSPVLLDPQIARIFNALTAGVIAIPTPPRTDLLSLLTYAPPIAAAGTPPGPVADVLRLNTGVPPRPPENANRLGLLGGDPAGFPNGRRPGDDVLDVLLRLVVGGILAGPPFSTSPINPRLGDGVNVNDAPFLITFPYLAGAPSGRSRRHVDPGEPQCTPLFGGGAPCLP